MTSPYRAVILATVLAICATGCGETKGPAEKAGAAVDKAAHDTGKAIDKAADKTGEVLEKGADKVEDAVK